VSIDMDISGLQELQDANIRKIAALKPRGAFGRALQFIGTALHRYVVAITHEDTGALEASQRLDFDPSLRRASIFLDPSATNPRTGARVAEYGPEEHGRGGTHAFYGRAVRERGRRAVRGGMRLLTEEFLKR
jgi:hypothetical protein